MRFEDLHLIEPLLRAVRDEGYSVPTPVQAQGIPHVLAGRDLLGCAQTGTGKTAAFALPILQRLHAQPVPSPRHVRVLVLAPTRELATQIGDSFRTYGRHMGFRHHVIFGGVGQHPQTQALRHGVDIVVATPGRLLDLMQQGFAKLNRVEVLVLDEADRMLDMGFIHDVRRIVSAVPRKRQTLFFSATLPHDIRTLAHDILIDPVRVEVTPTATTVDKVAQSVCFVGKGEKFTLLQKLLHDPAIGRALVFTRTKHGANKLARQLNAVAVRADAIHGNKAQTARERALEDFARGRIRVLVATDIAARGIDVEGITHVFNYDLPNIADSYVHRIGRTARAGAAGTAISFCSPEEREDLAGIERLIRMRIPVQPGSPDLHRTETHAPTHRPHHPAASHGAAPGNFGGPRHPAAHRPGTAPAHGGPHAHAHGGAPANRPKRNLRGRHPRRG
ncbi:MAG: DEAD/DEAH box helicase [Planctomycetes bacterium]|nr:DEAD/DEAH box helicase [Planctomycetota bacterium]